MGSILCAAKVSSKLHVSQCGFQSDLQYIVIGAESYIFFFYFYSEQ